MVVEAYFDESYRKDDEPQTFCVAGYAITAPAARAMQEEWRLVLAKHGAPYWHSREIQNAEGTDAFAGWTMERRSELQRDLIGLIKKYTLEGIAIVDAHSRLDGKSAESSVYSTLSDAAARAIRGFADLHRIGEAGLVVFEAGHPYENSAKEKVAAFCGPLGISFKFTDKLTEPLLQAADLLAWHSRKYVQDTAPNPEKPHRKDFAALLEHSHSIFRLVEEHDERTSYVELWPVERRAMYGNVTTRVDYSGPVPVMLHDEDPTPVLMCSRVGGWKPGFAGLLYLKCFNTDGDPFYLAMSDYAGVDMMRQLHEGGEAMWGQNTDPDEDR